MSVSKHASKRIRERLNIPKKSHKKLYENMLKRGYSVDQLKGNLSIWVKVILMTKSRKGIVYNNHLFILDSKNDTLITVYKIPPKLLKDLK